MYPDGHTREQSYDTQGRITSRCYKYASASYCYAATYDGAGNPLTTSDPYGGSETYTYDALNRLTSVTRSVSGAVEHTESYSYNAIGALHTTYDPIAGAAVTMDDQRPVLSGTGTSDAAIPKTLAGQPVTLDGGGRVTSINGVTLAYRFDSLLASAEGPSGAGTVTESFNYDAYSRLVERSTVQTSPAMSTREFYRYDGLNLIATTDASGKLQDAYLYDGIDHPLRLARTSPCSGADAGATCSQSYFYEIDLTGNVRRLRDASGADLGGYRYTAFGQAFPTDAPTPAPTIDQPWRWKGRPLDEVTELYDMRARWWSPQLGAFLTIDQYAYQDPNSTLWGWPGQNPVRYADRRGHDGWALAYEAAPEIGPIAATAALATGLVAANAYIWGSLLPAQIQGLMNDLDTPTVYAQENQSDEEENDSEQASDPGTDQCSTDALKEAGKAPDRGDLTKAGRALQKHGNRGGSVFDPPQGPPQAINEQGQEALEDILDNVTETQPNRFGGTDYYGGSQGGGARFDGEGNFIGFLEP